MKEQWKSCLDQASKIVRSYRAQAPEGYDVFNGGGMPKAPPPPAPPQRADAADAALAQLKKRKPQGLQSTILTNQQLNPANKTLLGS